MIGFDSELFPQNFVWQLNNDRKASIYTMNALNKSSELWHTSVNRKARPVVGEHDKNWNDHGASFESVVSSLSRWELIQKKPLNNNPIKRLHWLEIQGWKLLRN